jgi:small subunit ribosomal protein S5
MLLAKPGWSSDMADENDIQAQAGIPAAVEGEGQGRGRRGRGGGERGRGGDRGGRGRRDDRRGKSEEEQGEELVEKLVHINRVSKTVKGGKRFGFAALVVVGDGKGRVGFGHGKAREVPEAVRKATEGAKRALIRVPLREGRTLHHDVNGRWGAGKVTLRTAPPGTGIIAGGPMRAVFESLGMADVVAKSTGSSNPYNMVRATIDALKKQTSPRMVANRRGKKVSDVLRRGGDAAAVAE